MKKYALRIEHAQSVLSNLCGSLSEADLTAAYAEFVDSLVAAFKSCAVEPVRVDTHQFAALEHIKSACLLPSAKYLCFDSQSSFGIPLGVSRHFDLESGKQIGITSRPGFDELGDQINHIKQKYGTVFGVIEDDIYTGGTIIRMVNILKSHGITVISIICGISLMDNLMGVPVQAAVYYKPGELLELTDPRDYIFGAANGGLVVSHQGQKLRVPYDAAFVDMAARSSIGSDKVGTFSQAIRAANFKLHRRLGSLHYPAHLLYPELVLHHASFTGEETIGGMLTTPVRQIQLAT